MKRIFATATLALLGLAVLAGCGAVPGAASAVSAGGGARISTTTPSALVGVRGDAQKALQYQRLVLGTDEVRPGADRDALDLVAQNYRRQSAASVALARKANDLGKYVSRLEAARKRDAGLQGGTGLGSADLAWTVGEYQAAYKAVADDIDARLGATKRERPE
ncbi:MAG: hypothetical protein FJZ01_08235 [Candidatus Sericytochromatia bacterium]|nr:hypothetical protein [Candidatus Tanganyikabacteria bacterium]